MASSQQQWRYGSQQLLMLVAVLALVIFVGGADAWQSCPKGFKGCNPKKPGCETCIAKDVDNCGACGNKCPELSYAVSQCSGGHCQYSCKPGFANCDNKWNNGCEVDKQTDLHNCGKCGNQCKWVANAVTQCTAGKCGEPVCKSGWGNCDGNIWSNGCEKDLSQDELNCGKCGNQCKWVANAVTQCKAGKCGEPVCKSGWGNCDGNIWSNGCEKDLSQDVLNCGKCGNQCPCTLKGGEPTCSAGKCGQQCKKGSKYDEVKKCCVPTP